MLISMINGTRASYCIISRHKSLYNYSTCHNWDTGDASELGSKLENRGGSLCSSFNLSVPPNDVHSYIPCCTRPAASLDSHTENDTPDWTWSNYSYHIKHIKVPWERTTETNLSRCSLLPFWRVARSNSAILVIRFRIKMSVILSIRCKISTTIWWSSILSSGWCLHPSLFAGGSSAHLFKLLRVLSSWLLIDMFHLTWQQKHWITIRFLQCARQTCHRDGFHTINNNSCWWRH